MAQALEQTDIDALMNAEAAEVLPVRPEAPQIFSRFRRDFENVEIRDYDFKRPERISKDQMRALHTLHDNFARTLGATLSGLLQTIVDVRVAHAEQMTYSEFIAALPNPTCFNLVETAQLEGRMCLELSPLVVYPIVDRMLGGSSQDLFIPQREMTRIEIGLVNKVLAHVTASFTEAWAEVRHLDFRLDRMESNPQLVQIVPPNEVVVVVGFEVRLGPRAGTMSLCIPFKVIEPLVEDLSAQSWNRAARAAGQDRFGRVIAGKLRSAALEVRGILAETTISMEELRNLEVGDILVTEKPATAPVVLAVAGRGKFDAVLGQVKGTRALNVVAPMKPVGGPSEGGPDC